MCSVRPRKLISFAETAAKCGVSESTLSNYLNRNSPYYKPRQPKPIHHGGRTLFEEGEVDDYISDLLRLRDEEEAHLPEDKAYPVDKALTPTTSKDQLGHVDDVFRAVRQKSRDQQNKGAR